MVSLVSVVFGAAKVWTPVADMLVVYGTKSVVKVPPLRKIGCNLLLLCNTAGTPYDVLAEFCHNCHIGFRHNSGDGVASNPEGVTQTLVGDAGSKAAQDDCNTQSS